MESNKIIPKGILFPFILLTTLFFAWAVPNNLTDTMLAAFKRIMSMSDSKTAWIQVVCYLLGYGCCAVPGALFIKKYTYKSGVMLGLGLYAFGALLFYPAMLSSGVNIDFSFFMYLLAIFVLFAGLSILETSTNSYVLAIGPESTATRRLNLSQAFNPFGAITGVVISQIFILSQLNGMTANDALHLAYNSIIRELAEKGDCVFVGRCADYILEQAKIDHISLFIAAPFEWRVKRKMEQLSIDEKSATAMVRKKDKDRKAYYDYYTGRNWGRPYEYDLCINSSRLGIEATAEKLVEMIRELEK